MWKRKHATGLPGSLHSGMGFGEIWRKWFDAERAEGTENTEAESVASDEWIDVATLRRSNVGGVRNSPVEGNCLSPSFDASLERNSFKQLSSSTFELDGTVSDVVIEE